MEPTDGAPPGVEDDPEGPPRGYRKGGSFSSIGSTGSAPPTPGGIPATIGVFKFPGRPAKIKRDNSGGSDTSALSMGSTYRTPKTTAASAEVQRNVDMMLTSQVPLNPEDMAVRFETCMYVFMCVCMYACMYICMYAFNVFNVSMYIRMHLCLVYKTD